jgi:hypothetical protein
VCGDCRAVTLGQLEEEPAVTIEDLLEKANALAAQIATAEGEARYELHQELHRALENIRAKGGTVPARLHSLDLELVDEEVEDSFDNMPV